ncbi:MAG: AAA family ATPase [Roseivirga sp.]|nr:AAA family ATPase [Roseivirga sp.]
MDIYIITGPPYSGKGTQSEILTRELQLKHISTGDRCRLEQEQQTAIGLVMAEYHRKGDLVPDSIMKSLFGQILDENIEEIGIILDGYPRTTAQVDTLLELVREKGLRIKRVLNIEVPRAELMKRAMERASTSDREDDKAPATHIKRIEIFEATTKPAIAYMKEKLRVDTFNGMGTIEETSRLIRKSFNQ